ncbi:MAG: rhomboid family intramembrane serine protease [Bacteroidetes bacterium]|nr:MAG: rhomboid family intramembrane serine protease [Bacteroidota bacterium]TDI81386.1 MAG: rhomboid family intramembrane serine protease [Bacteroidota bacterium]
MGRITETVKVLIIINVLFFVGKLTMPDLADRLFSLYYFENPNFGFWQPITHMFMHGDIGHILFNMFGLWMFGSPLEIRWGRNKFLFFYFSAGLGAALIHTLVNYYHFHAGFDTLLAVGASENEIWDVVNNTLKEGSYRELKDLGTQAQNFFTSYNTPALGASGAIYGVLVAFGLMYPNMELMLIFLPIPIKAKYFIPVLILIDLFSGITGFSLFGQGIAHWAHIGGALFGFLMAYYWKRNSFNDKRWN